MRGAGGGGQGGERDGPGVGGEGGRGSGGVRAAHPRGAGRRLSRDGRKAAPGPPGPRASCWPRRGRTSTGRWPKPRRACRPRWRRPGRISRRTPTRSPTRWSSACSGEGRPDVNPTRTRRAIEEHPSLAARARRAAAAALALWLLAWVPAGPASVLSLPAGSVLAAAVESHDPRIRRGACGAERRRLRRSPRPTAKPARTRHRARGRWLRACSTSRCWRARSSTSSARR